MRSGADLESQGDAYADAYAGADLAIKEEAPAAESRTLLSRMQTRHERELVDHLREMGLDRYIELPQIAVMGDTSSGKSSVLSALSGVTFPSSNVLTTRCPTQLILSQGRVFRGNVRLHRFNGGPSEEQADLASMADVPEAIKRLTAKLVGEGQAFSDDTIVIELSGPGLPNLTLTDLPGLVRTVGDGEDHSIIERVRCMVQRFMQQQRTIILAVVPANVDMHNTEILQNAQEADPDGMRTIAVVTKMDCVDDGAELAVHELLLNKKKHMRLGYHAVKCRNQRELAENVSIADGVQNERVFFQRHEYWRKLPDHLCGIPRLSERLVEILQDNIRRSLPQVIAEIDARIDTAQQQLDALGMPFDSPSARRNAFCQWVNQYLQHLKAAMDGEYQALPPIEANSNQAKSKKGDGQSNSNSLKNDMRLRALLRDHEGVFLTQIDASKTKIPTATSPSDDETIVPGEYALVNHQHDGHWIVAKVVRVDGSRISVQSDQTAWLERQQWKRHPRSALRVFIEQNRGDELAIFPSYRVFCNLYGQIVDAWAAPATDLVSSYRREILRVSSEIAGAVQAPSRIEQFLKDRARDVLKTMTVKAEQQVAALLASEHRPYTQDGALFAQLDALRLGELERQLTEDLPRDRNGMVELAAITQWLRAQTLTNQDRAAIEMEFALRAYADVAIKRFADLIPMHVNALMLTAFVQRLEHELMGTMDDKLELLLREASGKAAMRERAARELECLQNAKDEIEVHC